MTEPLIEGRDYEIVSGQLVFTRDYLLRRGSCCKLGCRNCPYHDSPQESVQTASASKEPIDDEIGPTRSYADLIKDKLPTNKS